MERTIAKLDSEELIKIIGDALIAIIRDFGHVDEGYCLLCDDEPFQALNEIGERLAKRPDWPLGIFNQYIKALDERDYIQEKFDDASTFILNTIGEETATNS